MTEYVPRCGHCGSPRPDAARRHCESSTCNWWQCTNCRAMATPTKRHFQPVSDSSPGHVRCYCTLPAPTEGTAS